MKKNVENELRALCSKLQNSAKYFVTEKIKLKSYYKNIFVMHGY